MPRTIEKPPPALLHATPRMPSWGEVLFTVNPAGTLEDVAHFPLGPALDFKEIVVSAMKFSNTEGFAGFGTDTQPGSLTACFPLRVGGTAIALQPNGPTPSRATGVLLEAFNRQAAFAFERMRLADEARAFRRCEPRRKEMRSSLSSAGATRPSDAISSHYGCGALPCAANYRGAVDETTRRELLDSDLRRGSMPRKTGRQPTRHDSPRIRRDWTEARMGTPEEIVGSALTRLEAKLGGCWYRTLPARSHCCRSIPSVEQVFANLFENAIKDTLPDSPLYVRARTGQYAIVMEVFDSGPGLPAGSEYQVFEKFFRGSHMLASPALA